MWTTIRALMAGMGRQVLKAMGSWLASEGATFIAEFLPLAQASVRKAMTRTDLDNKAKFDLVRNELRIDLQTLGKAYKDRWINALIEIAVDQIKAEYEAQKAARAA